MKELEKIEPEDPRKDLFAKAGVMNAGLEVEQCERHATWRYAHRKRAKAGYMISAVAELYKLHPQTLRLYERVGLLKPSRSQGNTRLYTDEISNAST